VKASIIAGGRFVLTDLIKRELESSDYIIAADSGLDYLLDNNIKVDIIVGDFDSMSERAKKISEEKKDSILVFPKEKDYTDSYIAIKYAIDKGYKDIRLFGFVGSRLDHTLNNILFLDYLNNLGVKAEIIDENNKAFVLEGKISINKECLGNFNYISVIPTVSEISLTSEGLKYDVENLLLSPLKNQGRGISNELKEKNASISIKGRGGLIVYSKD